jgi:hypothetical protein
MPIRHCQKCSLKVLIDESQAGVSPFYCQRCTAALKSDGAGSPTPAQGNRRSSPKLTPVPAPSAVAVAAPPAAGKTSTVKVFCPYCKASFNGKIPAKPARGSCPLCQKDLILLPTGDIRPAADFDLAKWQAEEASNPAPAAATKESATMVLVKKFAAHPQSTSDSAEAGKKVLEEKAAPSPADETAAPEEGVELPSWLDESDKRLAAKLAAPVTAPPETDVAAEPVRLEDLPDIADPAPPPPPPKRAAAPAPPPPKPPPPPVSPPPMPAKAASSSSASTAAVAAVKKPVARREKTERRAAPVASQTEIHAPSGAGNFMLALLLTALPVVGCPILLSMKEKLREGFLATMGPRFMKGFKELDAKLFPVEEVEAPKPPPKPREPEPEAPAKPTAEDQRQMEDEINKRWMEYKREERTVRQLSVGATDAQKVEIEKAQAELKSKLTHIDQLRANYRKIFGKDHDPTKE